MPDLPTITVTTAQANRLLAIFGDAAGYRTWLKTALLAEAVRLEEERLQAASYVSIGATIDALRAELPAPDVDAK